MTLQNCLHLNGSGELIFEARDPPRVSMWSWDPDGSDETLPAQIGGGHQLTDFSKTTTEPGKKSTSWQKMSSRAQNMGSYEPGNHSKWPSGSPGQNGTLEIKIRDGHQLAEFSKTDSNSKNDQKISKCKKSNFSRPKILKLRILSPFNLYLNPMSTKVLNYFFNLGSLAWQVCLWKRIQI